MALALASRWRGIGFASASLLALGACEATTAPGTAQEPVADLVDRSPRVVSEIARGRQALAAGDLPSAQSAFTAALRGSPNDPEPAIGLAETYLAMGDLETAGRLFDIVASAGGGAGDARLLQGRGLVALGQGRTDEAIGLLEGSVERDATLWRAWAGLGRAYGREGNARLARSAFNRAEENAPSPAVVINDIGMLHLEENDPAAALESFQRALAVDPGNGVASANARIARAMLGEYDAAISGAPPEELPHVLNNVGYIAVVNGDFDVADRLLRRAIEISPVYHEAARANLDLLAQAMRGDPVVAPAGSGAEGSGMTAIAEPASVGGTSAGDGAGASAPPDGGGRVAADGWSELSPSPTAEPATAPPLAEMTAPPAAELAPVPARASAADAEGGVMAHGFRWESRPLSAAPAERRAKRRAARSSMPPDAGDPRGTAWPAVSVPPVESAAESPPEAAQEHSQRAPAKGGSEPAETGAAETGEAETGEAETGEAEVGEAEAGAAATGEAGTEEAAAGENGATEPQGAPLPAGEESEEIGLPE